jgi:hypothetical protein
MRLDFNILWVEDQPKEVQATVDGLRRKLSAEGFELRHSFLSSVGEVKERLSGAIFIDEIDLVLVDWELGGGTTGDEALGYIRDAAPYKDLIFYSATSNTESLRRLAYDKKIDGVYFTNRDELVDEVEGVFGSLIKKTLDLDHIRGIVLGATSDIEQSIRQLLQVGEKKLNDQEKAKLLGYMVDLLKEKPHDISAQVEKMVSDATIAGIVEKHRTFTANDGARALMTLLECEAFSSLVGHVETLKVYMKDVVPHRNNLGHKVMIPGVGMAVAGETPAHTVTFDELKSLRKLLLELRQKFSDLHGSIS